LTKPLVIMGSISYHFPTEQMTWLVTSHLPLGFYTPLEWQNCKDERHV